MSGAITLVTGGAGFIGSHVTRALVASGRRVRVLVRPGEDARNLRDLPSVERVEGDVRRADDVRRALAGDVGAVFHLAAVYALWTPRPRTMHEVNVEGTRTVLREAFAKGVRRVVYTSSIAVFGGQGPGRDAAEESPYALGATGSEYAQSKKDAHDLVMREFVARGHDVAIAAPCGPLGPGDVGPTPTGKMLLSVLCDRVSFAVDLETNMGDVRDMARGHLLVEARGRAGESYLLGGENVSMTGLARMALAHAKGRTALVVKVPFSVALGAAYPAYAWATRVRGRAPLFSPSEVRIARLGLRADCAKAKRELGYETRPTEESVRDAVEWFTREGYAGER